MLGDDVIAEEYEELDFADDFDGEEHTAEASFEEIQESWSQTTSRPSY